MLESIIKKFLSPSGLLCCSLLFTLMYNINNFKNFGNSVSKSIESTTNLINESGQDLEYLNAEKDKAINNSWVLKKVNYLMGNKLSKGLGHVIIEETTSDGKKTNKKYNFVDFKQVSCKPDKPYAKRTVFGQTIYIWNLQVGECIMTVREEPNASNVIEKKYVLYYKSYTDQKVYSKGISLDNASLLNFDAAKEVSLEVNSIEFEKE